MFVNNPQRVVDFLSDISSFGMWFIDGINSGWGWPYTTITRLVKSFPLKYYMWGSCYDTWNDMCRMALPCHGRWIGEGKRHARPWVAIIVRNGQLWELITPWFVVQLRHIICHWKDYTANILTTLVHRHPSSHLSGKPREICLPEQICRFLLKEANFRPS